MNNKDYMGLYNVYRLAKDVFYGIDPKQKMNDKERDFLETMASFLEEMEELLDAKEIFSEMEDIE